jgi:hypothetical protein
MFARIAHVKRDEALGTFAFGAAIGVLKVIHRTVAARAFVLVLGAGFAALADLAAFIINREAKFAKHFAKDVRARCGAPARLTAVLVEYVAIFAKDRGANKIGALDCTFTRHNVEISVCDQAVDGLFLIAARALARFIHEPGFRGQVEARGAWMT